MSTSPKLKVINNHIYTSSLDLAKNFNKSHDQIMRAIRDALSNISLCTYAERNAFSRQNFGESTYKNSRGQVFPCYNLTRDGFAFVAMGLKGSKVVEWKIRYIQAFNEMEYELNARIIKDKHFGQLKFNFPDAGETIEQTLPFMTVSYAVARLTELGLMIPPVSRNQIISLIKRQTLAGFKNDREWCIYEESFNRFIKMRRGEFV